MSLMSYFDVTHIINIPASFNMYLVINKYVTAVKVSKLSGYYLCNHSSLGYIGIL
jgi:hypothetical protein